MPTPKRREAAVASAIAGYKPVVLLGGYPPPPIAVSEEGLPRRTRAALSQLRSGYSSRLQNYWHRLDAATPDACPECGASPHDVAHALACPSLPERVEPIELWTDPGNNNNKRREALWWAQSDFLLAVIGFAVGAGNLFRFPARVFTHGSDEGGGAFIISYLVCVIIIGWPVTYLQLYWGQFSGHSVTQVFGEIAPVFAGLGWAFVFITIPLAAHYNMIVAYALHYLWESIKALFGGGDLPWSNCDAFQNLSGVVCCDQFDDLRGHTAMEIYLHHSVFNRIGHSVIDWGSMQWPLLVCLAIAWAFTLFAMRSGIHSVGQIVYITATYPYFILLCIFIHATTLEGAFAGFRWYVTPDFSKLLSGKMWVASANQALYSLGIDVFALVSFAAYNRPRSNVWRDSLILVGADTLTSFLGGLVLFMLAGHMHLTTFLSDGMTILQSDPYGLAFVVYAHAMATVPMLPQLFSVLFFSMIVLVAIDCQFAWLEQIFGAVKHFCGHVLGKFAEDVTSGADIYVMGIICFSLFALGSVQCFQGGYAIFKLLDHYTVLVNEFVLIGLTLSLVAFIYGSEQVFLDIGKMLKHRYPCLDESSNRVRKESKKQAKAPFLFKLFGPTGTFFKIAWLLLPFLLAILVALAILKEIDNPAVVLPTWDSVRSLNSTLVYHESEWLLDEAMEIQIYNWTRVIGLVMSILPLVIAAAVAIYRKWGQQWADVLKPKRSWRQRIRRYDSEFDECGSLANSYPGITQRLVAVNRANTQSQDNANSSGQPTQFNSLRLRRSQSSRLRQLNGRDNTSFELNEFAATPTCTPSSSHHTASQWSVSRCACQPCIPAKLNNAYNVGGFAAPGLQVSPFERPEHPTPPTLLMPSRFLITSVTDEDAELATVAENSDADLAGDSNAND